MPNRVSLTKQTVGPETVSEVAKSTETVVEPIISISRNSSLGSDRSEDDLLAKQISDARSSLDDDLNLSEDSDYERSELSSKKTPKLMNGSEKSSKELEQKTGSEESSREMSKHKIASEESSRETSKHKIGSEESSREPTKQKSGSIPDESELNPSDIEKKYYNSDKASNEPVNLEPTQDSGELEQDDDSNILSKLTTPSSILLRGVQYRNLLDELMDTFNIRHRRQNRDLEKMRTKIHEERKSFEYETYCSILEKNFNLLQEEVDTEGLSGICDELCIGDSTERNQRMFCDYLYSFIMVNGCTHVRNTKKEKF